MKLLFVHAHFDDYEFTAAGTFELWRRAGSALNEPAPSPVASRHPLPSNGPSPAEAATAREGGRGAGGEGKSRGAASLERRVLICTDGAAGHHLMAREETARRRWKEQEASAQLGGFEVRLLQNGTGRPFREGRLHASPEFLPALWHAIRGFEPDYLFCPPIPEDRLAGVHVDHLDVANAVRSVAYLLNVPHAFDLEWPAPSGSGEPRSVRTPVILTLYDGYMAGGHGHDLAVDISAVADFVADLAWCHESQLREWLPWVDRHNLVAPSNLAAWRCQFREILERRKRALGIAAEGLFEAFTVTAWGLVPTLDQLCKDLPGIAPAASKLEALGRRLEALRAAAGE